MKGEEVKLEEIEVSHTLGKTLQNGEMIDWSVCLLVLKNLVSLQPPTKPSFQTDLDLYTAGDK